MLPISSADRNPAQEARVYVTCSGIFLMAGTHYPCSRAVNTGVIVGHP